MNFILPTDEELALLRPDPLLVEQELDVRPEVAGAIESAVGFRSGRAYWRSEHDHLYAVELADTGRGRPSMATVYGHWDRFEPRPPEHEIDADLMTLLLWIAEISPGIEPSDVERVAQFAGVSRTWPAGAVLRTPEARFADLPGFAWEPRYVEIEGLRMAWVERGEGRPILLLHGEPTWGYLYRHMIEPLAAIGRVIVPDLVGFGRSDKPAATSAYSYKSHTRWMRRFIEALDLRKATLVCQDWGGLIGLRVLSQMPDRFARLVAMNTGIADGRGATDAFLRWRRFSQRVTELDVPMLMRSTLTRRKLSDGEAAAYGAPYPSREYQTAALVFPRLVPIRPDHPGAFDNRLAREVLRTLRLPTLFIWGEADAITRPAERDLRGLFPHAAPTVLIPGAGHFIQEDAGEEVALAIRAWVERE